MHTKDEIGGRANVSQRVLVERPSIQIVEHQKFFDLNGFVVLPELFSAAEIDTAQQTTDRVKRDRPFNVVIDNLENGDRTVLGMMSPEAVRHDRMKINDLYLTEPGIRDLALAPRILSALETLFGHTPALCNSLYLEKGSEQDLHVDALYMTPRTPLHLIASWVAMEDSSEEAGQLEYIPGSHLIAPMIFSNGSHHVIENEMGRWRDYMETNCQERQLGKQTFKAKKGDVLFWHAQLYHGGGRIRDRNLTRKSCVFHYFSESDARASGCALAPHADAFWIDRPPQQISKELSARLPYDETAYLRRNPDVAEAVRRGRFDSGRAHYEQYGKSEGRFPC